MPKYQADAYLRLSYTTDHSEESDSISNQKKLIEDFVASHPDIEIVSERVDDGYSGGLFDCPAFQEMMADIMAGKINCVIVKDLSRLGREYIETGRYLKLYKSGITYLKQRIWQAISSRLRWRLGRARPTSTPRRFLSCISNMVLPSSLLWCRPLPSVRACISPCK